MFTGDSKEIKNHIPHGKLQLLLSNKLKNLDKDIEGCVPWHHIPRSYREEAINDALKADLGCHVTLTFDAYNVDPEKAVKGLQSNTRHLRITMLSRINIIQYLTPTVSTLTDFLIKVYF